MLFFRVCSETIKERTAKKHEVYYRDIKVQNVLSKIVDVGIYRETIFLISAVSVGYTPHDLVIAHRELYVNFDGKTIKLGPWTLSEVTP